MEKLQWLFELIDKMSGPASKIDKAMSKVDGTMKKAGASGGGASGFAKAIGWISKTFSPAEAAGVLRFAGGVAKLGEKFESLKPAMGAVGKGALAVAGMVATIGIAIGAATAGLAIAGAGWALHFLTFKEDSIAAFKAMTGSKEAAERIFMMSASFASKTPFKESEVIAMAQTLMTRGFKEAELPRLMLGVGDIGAMLGMEKMQSVIGALGKMRASGVLTGETMQMLADAGINVKLVYAALAKQLGKTEAQVKQMISAGKVTDKAGIDATMDAIAKGISGGELGGAMKEKSQTLTGLLSTLAGVPENLMAHANMSGLMDPIKGFISDLIGSFIKDGKITEVGHRVIALFETIGNTIGEIIGMAKGQTLTDFIEGALNVLEPLVKLVMGFMRGFGAGFLPVLQEAFQIFSKADPKDMEDMVRGFVQLGIVVGTIAGYMVSAGITFASFVVWVLDGIGEIIGAFDDLGTKINDMDLTDVGVNLVEGLLNGILSMLNPAGGVMTMLGDVLIESLESRLRISSPSDATFDTGRNTGLGLLNGIESTGLQEAWGNLNMNPSQFVSNEIVSKGGGNGGGSEQISMDGMVNHFHIEGANKDGNEIAKEASTSFSSQLASILSRTATEAGR